MMVIFIELRGSRVGMKMLLGRSREGNRGEEEIQERRGVGGVETISYYLWLRHMPKDFPCHAKI